MRGHGPIRIACRALASAGRGQAERDRTSHRGTPGQAPPARPPRFLPLPVDPRMREAVAPAGVKLSGLLEPARARVNRCYAVCRMSPSPGRPWLILIAGPYRSGSNDDPLLIAASVASMESFALPIFRAGHLQFSASGSQAPPVCLRSATGCAWETPRPVPAKWSRLAANWACRFSLRSPNCQPCDRH